MQRYKNQWKTKSVERKTFCVGTKEKKEELFLLLKYETPKVLTVQVQVLEPQRQELPQQQEQPEPVGTQLS